MKPLYDQEVIDWVWKLTLITTSIGIWFMSTWHAMSEEHGVGEHGVDRAIGCFYKWFAIRRKRNVYKLLLYPVVIVVSIGLVVFYGPAISLAELGLWIKAEIKRAADWWRNLPD
jgi:hypothetical protein